MAAQRITGAKELDRVLRQLPGRLAKRELTSAARAGANVIRREIRAGAPRGQDPSPASGKYGPLHKNIRVTEQKNSQSSVTMIIHSGRAFWALFLEFGTVNMPGLFFFASGLESSQRLALAKLGDRLGKGIEKISRELAGPVSNIRKSTRSRL